VWEDLKDLDALNVTKDEVVPPLIDVTNDWRVKLQKYKSNPTPNKVSKYSLETVKNKQTLDLLKARNVLKDTTDAKYKSNLRQTTEKYKKESEKKNDK